MNWLSMNETTTFRWSFEEDLANYAAAGIPSLGVWREKLSDCGETKAIELLRDSGLKASHLFWAGGFTGSDGRPFRNSLEDAVDAIRTAAKIGAGTLVVYSGGRAGHTLNHARRLFKDALLALAPQAAEQGLSLAIEPMHPGCATEFTFLTSIDEVLSLLAVVNRPEIKIVFDAYHVGQDERILPRIPELVERIAIVQLGDARHPPHGEQNRCRLGEGRIPLKEIVTALRSSGYQGYYDVELLGEGIQPRDYFGLLEHAKQAYGGLLNPCSPSILT
jgi:sugar phosphate isomerase/epimerase